jgi:hypothetical protein
MSREKLQTELKRLRQEQLKMREGEVFGGFSELESEDYLQKSRRIQELQNQIEDMARY